jgi:hypothetical protein
MSADPRFTALPARHQTGVTERIAPAHSQPDPASKSKRLWKRRLVVLLILLLVFFVGAGFFVDLSPNAQISKSNYKAVTIGMSRQQVVAILGQPGTYWQRQGKELSKADDWAHIQEEGSRGTPGAPCEWKDWQGDHGVITVYFHQESVIGKQFLPPPQWVHIRWYCWVLYTIYHPS